MSRRVQSWLPLIMAMSMILCGCGFHVRGPLGMSFDSIYIDAPNYKSLLVTDLRRELEASHAKLAENAEHADVVLQVVSETSDQQILTLSPSGTVTEYRLIYRVSLRAYDHHSRNWIPPEIMELHRDFTYDNTLVLAKEAEAAQLSDSMRAELAQLIIRRLSKAIPQPQ
jgi:LPS-assembly lipoprotein